MKTQKQVRQSFWDSNPFWKANEYKARKRQNQYHTDIRCAFVDYVDYLQKDGIISQALAQRITL